VQRQSRLESTVRPYLYNLQLQCVWRSLAPRSSLVVTHAEQLNRRAKSISRLAAWPRSLIDRHICANTAYTMSRKHSNKFFFRTSSNLMLIVRSIRKSSSVSDEIDGKAINIFAEEGGSTMWQSFLSVGWITQHYINGLWWNFVQWFIMVRCGQPTMHQWSPLMALEVVPNGVFTRFSKRPANFQQM